MSFIDILNLVYLYPFVMSMFWITAGLRFFVAYVRRNQTYIDTGKLPELDQYPLVSVLVPCYNEEEVAEATIEKLYKYTKYPNFEVICIDDGSKDRTWEVLENVYHSGKYPTLRIIRVVHNAGKAHALTQGAIAARGEYLLGVDADSFLGEEAMRQLVTNIMGKKNAVTYFLGTKRKGIGAVTGNPIVRNRSTLLAKIQLAEFSSVIGLIKRAQRIYGRIGTVSGVCVLFRRRALMDVGWWDQDMITEDIAVTWKLQLNGWEVNYEPGARCWMLVPETIKGLWAQRVRWAQGGAEVLIRHIGILWKPRLWAQLPVLLEQMASIIWTFLWQISMIIFFYNWLVLGNLNWMSVSLGGLLVVVCILQLAIAVRFSRRYDPGIMRYVVWAAWYPFLYWFINPLTVTRALPKAIKAMRKGGQATWTSPDRGLSGSPATASAAR